MRKNYFSFINSYFLAFCIRIQYFTSELSSIFIIFLFHQKKHKILYNIHYIFIKNNQFLPPVNQICYGKMQFCEFFTSFQPQNWKLQQKIIISQHFQLSMMMQISLKYSNFQRSSQNSNYFLRYEEIWPPTHRRADVKSTTYRKQARAVQSLT